MVSHPTSRRVSIERCVELMSTRYQWADTTRVNAHDYLSRGRFAAFCADHDIDSVADITNELVLDFMGDLREKPAAHM